MLCSPKLLIASSIAVDSKIGRFDDVDVDGEEMDVLLLEFEVDGTLGSVSSSKMFVDGLLLSPNVLMAVLIALDSTRNSSVF